MLSPVGNRTRCFPLNRDAMKCWSARALAASVGFRFLLTTASAASLPMTLSSPICLVRAMSFFLRVSAVLSKRMPSGLP